VRSRPFIALYIAVLVATMGISMVSPLLPVYAKDLGANGVWLGLTFSVFAIVQTFVGPFAGRLSDKFGRKPFIILGLAIYIIAAVGYLTAENFYQVIGFRAFSGFGTSLIFSVARAYVGDMTPNGSEGRWLGVFATADIAGFGTGPLIAGVLREITGFRSVFVAMAAMLAFSAFILIWWLPRHSPAELRRRAGEPARHENVTFKEAAKERLVMAVTLYMGLQSLAYGAILSFLALRLEDSLHASPVAIGAAFATQDLTGGLAQPMLGRLADRFDRRILVVIGLTGNAAWMVYLGFAPAYILVVLRLFLMGAGNGLAGVSASALQVVAGRKVGMGTVLGLGSASNGLGIVIGSVVAGVLVDMFATSAAFVFAGALTLAGVPVFLTLTKGVPTRESEVEPVIRPMVEEAAGGH
jgi:MFS family permease